MPTATRLLMPSSPLLVCYYCLVLISVSSFIECKKSRNGEVMASSPPPWRKKCQYLHDKVSGGGFDDDQDKIASTLEEDEENVSTIVVGEPSKRMQQSLQSSTTTSTTTTSGTNNRMPSIFMKPEEQYLDKYAACLAATEGLRKLRDSAAAANSNPIQHALRKLINKKEVHSQQQQQQYRQACSEYALNSNKVIRALGLSVAQFNQIGRYVTLDPVLKQKVMEQAYLYRITATLKMDKIPLIEDPNSEALLRGGDKSSSSRNTSRRVQMFAKSMHDIEELRQEQTEKLLKALSIDSLPDSVNISDPKVLPFLSPQIRAVVEAFPLQAEEIVKKYGLSSDEFNTMLQETNTNKNFRMQVEDQLKKSTEESKLQRVFQK